MTENPWIYKKNVIATERGKEYYAKLKDLVNPERQKITVWNNKGIEHRRTAFFSKDDHDFTYSGVKNTSKGWPDVINELAEIAEKETGQTYDSALVNFYEHGEDHVGEHSDRDGLGFMIASFSFGVTRDFKIRRKEPRELVETIPLEHCSLVIMKPEMQKSYSHEVPKRLKVKEGRINVTLRLQGTKRGVKRSRKDVAV